jgi:hypothetical protein
MSDVRGVSFIGATAADAPPTNEKVNPAAPNTGTDFVTRFRFEACFTCAIVASSIPCKNCSEFSATIVTSADAPRKLVTYVWL